MSLVRGDVRNFVTITKVIYPPLTILASNCEVSVVFRRTQVIGNHTFEVFLEHRDSRHSMCQRYALHHHHGQRDDEWRLWLMHSGSFHEGPCDDAWRLPFQVPFLLFHGQTCLLNSCFLLLLMNALLRLWRVTNERAQGKILKSFCSGMQNTFFGRSLFFYSDGEHLAARAWGGHIDNIGHRPAAPRPSSITEQHNEMMKQQRRRYCIHRPVPPLLTIRS